MRVLPLIVAVALVGCRPPASQLVSDGGVVSVDLPERCLAPEPAPPAADAGCPIVWPAERDVFDEALGRLGLDRCSLTLPGSTFPIPADAYRLPWFDQAHDWPVNGPTFAHRLVLGLDSAAASETPVAQALVLMGNRLGAASLSPCVPGATFDHERPLAKALADLITAAGGTVDQAVLDEDASDVPLDLQVAVAQVITAVATANGDWKKLTANLTDADLTALAQTPGLILPYTLAGPPNPNTPAVSSLLSKRWDVQTLVAGAARFAAAVEQARLSRFAGAKGFSFDQPTPWGRIVIRDAADDVYEDDGRDAIAVLVDTGGNDVYRKPIGAVGGSQVVRDRAIRVAVAVDLAGDDSYGYPESPDPLDSEDGGVVRLPSDGSGRHVKAGSGDDGAVSQSEEVRQGGARLGYGMLFDLGSGRDHYRSLRMSQGFGAAGVGVLFDEGGDDLYEGEAGVQGSGVWGAGLLVDLSGNDTYKTYADSQGFGFVRGAGVLYDRFGDDQYLANTGIPALGGDPIYYSPQAPCPTPTSTCGNSSFSQGAGFGRRAAGTSADSAFMSGGLGVLRDVSGADRYEASIFAQGTGYWFGTGILSDGAGDDRYDGWWYTQGSDAHAALCVFEDGAGNDRYDVTYPANPPYATNTGQGHDYSIGWHLDWGGDDQYRGTGLGLGAGNANGGGFLVNVGGNDTYSAPGGTVLGGAAFDLSISRPQSLPCYGVFIDVGGQDTYTVPDDPLLTPHPADGLSWTNARNPPPYRDLSVGLDRDGGTVRLP